MIVDFTEISTGESQHYLQHAIAPRPICFASTINGRAEVNLSPFSFFNVFSSHPPIVIFSPSRRARNNTTKDTYENVSKIPEVTINIVDHDMIQQMSLSSCEYPKGINEFTKAGFTMALSKLVKPTPQLDNNFDDPIIHDSNKSSDAYAQRVADLPDMGDIQSAWQLVLRF